MTQSTPEQIAEAIAKAFGIYLSYYRLCQEYPMLAAVITQIQTAAEARGYEAGWADMKQLAATHAICAFDDRSRSQPSNIDWNDGHREGTRDAARAIHNIPTQKDQG